MIVLKMPIKYVHIDIVGKHCRREAWDEKALILFSYRFNRPMLPFFM